MAVAACLDISRELENPNVSGPGSYERVMQVLRWLTFRIPGFRFFT